MNILDDIKHQYKFGGMNQKLIFLNIGVFLLSVVFFFKFSEGKFSYPEWLALSGNLSVSLKYVWTYIIYSFLHAGIFHLIFNLIILNFAGNLFLTFFNQKQLLGVYILGAAFAGLAYVLAYTFIPQLDNNAVLVGASASIMAILFATVTYAPLMTIRLLLIGYVKLWHIALVILLLDIVQIGVSNTGGHIAHLAGALFGFLFTSQIKKGSDITRWFNGFLDYVVNLFSRKKKSATPFKKVHKNKTAPQNRGKVNPVSKDKTQQQIDEILDKISRSGYDSLTKEEKEFLFKAGKE